MSENINSLDISQDQLADKQNKYPFNVDAITNFTHIDFHPNVTFIIGDNGTGKSTLLEAIAMAWGFNPEGGSVNFNFSTKNTHSDLYKHFRLSRGFKKARDGFFLRAESFYNVASNIDNLDAEPTLGAKIIGGYGDKSLHEQSHGESFFSTIKNRFFGNGLYILDEPEAALSPSRQMALLRIMKDLVDKNSQFIIATHSPIILSYPNSTIYEISSKTLKPTKYEDTELFNVTKNFLNNHNRMLHSILE